MKLPIFLGAAVLAVAVFSPKSIFDKHVATLQAAKTLDATFTVQHLPAPAETYRLSYAKPNMILIDGPASTVESDGSTIWTYDKAKNSYTEAKFSGAGLGKAIGNPDVFLWTAFFTSEPFKEANSVTGGTSRVIKGNPVTEVSVGFPDQQLTLYVDDKLGVARGMSLTRRNTTTLVTASKLDLGDQTVGMDKFAFHAPEGATKTEITANAVTWEANIGPLFAQRCGGCHGGGRSSGGYSVASYQSAVSGVVVPGNPDRSSLLGFLTGAMQPRMPQRGAPFSADEINLVRAWIQAGAPER